MKNFYIFFFFTICISVFSESEVKNTRTLKVGIIRDKFTESEINGQTFNELLINMFEKELGYNIETLSGNWQEINDKFSSGEIEVMFPVEKSFPDQSSVFFSDNMYSLSFYAASNRINIRDLWHLNGKTVYILKGFPYRYYLENVFKSNNIVSKIIEVEDISEYEDKITIQPSTHVQDILYKYRIGILPFSVIAYNGDSPQFINDVNLALNRGYRNAVIKHKNDIEKKFRTEFFLSSLTDEEKKLLNNFKELNIAYEENAAVSHYLPETKSYRGLIPLVIEEISEHLDFKINIVNSPMEQWETVLERFEKKESDILSMVKTESREIEYIFSRKITDIKVYKINALNYDSKYQSKRIGVIEDSIEHFLARHYYKEGEVVSFKHLADLISSLKHNKISSALNFDMRLVAGSNYTIENFYSVPMHLAFSKDNEVLRNIFDKAYERIIDKDILIEQFLESEKAYLEEKLEKATATSLWYRAGGIIAFLIGLTTSILTFVFFKARKTKKLAELAFTDSLSNLGNRYSFDRFCKNMDNKEGISIVIDLDNFKKANDMHGHDTGDQIIKHYADILKSIFNHERIFRISGDEYYIFIEKNAHLYLIKKLVSAVNNSKFLRQHSITSSIGYSIKTPEKDLITCFKYADMAMYEAKLIKGNSYFKATEEFIKKMEKLSCIRNNIEKAIETEFYPVFQPKISIQNPERIIGAEALARWHSPALGPIFPDEFIPVAEEIKIISIIDLKIAEESIKLTKKLIEENLVRDDFIMSFNLSMYTFDNEDVPQLIKQLLSKYALPGKNIEMEITESVISKNLTETLDKLKRLKELGIYLSLDDFTAGHSTAGILPFLPIDIVKFDRSLMQSIRREKGSLVYTALIKLIKNMGFSITAEGIENEDEYIFLKKHGVETGQGYFFGRPVKESEFRSRL